MHIIKLVILKFVESLTFLKRFYYEYWINNIFMEILIIFCKAIFHLIAHFSNLLLFLIYSTFRKYTSYDIILPRWRNCCTCFNFILNYVVMSCSCNTIKWKTFHNICEVPDSHLPSIFFARACFFIEIKILFRCWDDLKLRWG